MIVKNAQYEITIHDLGSNGEGIGKINDFTVFVEHAVPGDTLLVQMLKVKKSYGHGKILQIIKPSPQRTKPVCPSFFRCGGCSLQHIQYPEQLLYKQKKVKDCLERIAGLRNCRASETIGMEKPFLYRNKAQFPIGLADGLACVCLYAPRSHRTIPVSKCHIQHPAMEDITACMERFLRDNRISVYDEETGKGLARHLYIRAGFVSREIMVCLVINGKQLPHQEKLLAALRENPSIKSIVLNHNIEKTNVVLGCKTTILWGKETIMDEIGGSTFEISPLSFFQVNPVQTKILYEKALELSGVRENDVVLDAYCGIGTISLFMARKARKVYGIETVAEAVRDAKQNAARNGVTNVEFITGEAEKAIPILYQRLAEAKEEPPNIVIVDPPRKGCAESLLAVLLEQKPEKIVYVSCDPATMARDLRFLCGNGMYEVKEVQPVDCFPMTAHVETVVLMSRME